MIKRLTTNNKKKMMCSCGNTFSWNTIEQSVVTGNRIIECPECGTRYITPSSELLPYFNNNTISYTSNIYSDSSGSGESSPEEELGRLFVLFTQGEEEAIASKSFNKILQQIEYNYENGIYQRNNIQGLYYIQFNNYEELMLLNLEEITMDVNYNPLALHFIGYAVQPVNKQARKVEIIYSSTGELSIEQTPCSVKELSSLSGTSWKIPSGTDMTPVSKNGSFPETNYINYTLNKGNITGNGQAILYLPVGPSAQQIIFSQQGDSTILHISSPYQLDEDLFITITGGQDIYKEDLIDWLNNNAEQITSNSGSGELNVEEEQVTVNPANPSLP